MSEYRKLLAAMRRPPILMQAVRHGLTHYRREPVLKRLAAGETAPLRALPHLLAREARLEETRLKGEAGYSPARHVEVLVALVAEARRLDRARPCEARGAEPVVPSRHGGNVITLH